MTETRPQAAKLRGAVAAEQAAWDRATERRADAEYAFEQFTERQDLSDEEKEDFLERCERMQAVINVRVEEEKEAERIWRQALNRAEREMAGKERRLR